jgi:hypothetical protein
LSTPAHSQDGLREKGIYVNAKEFDSFGAIVEYLITPTAKKPIGELDRSPFYSEGFPTGPRLTNLIAAGRRLAASLESRRRKAAGYGSEAAEAPDGEGNAEEGSKGQGEAKGKGKGKGRPRAPQIYDVVVDHKLSSMEDLEALAEKMAEEGDRSLARYVSKNAQKVPAQIMSALKISGAGAKAAEMKKTRIQKLTEVSTEVACICGGAWPPAAESILRNNGHVVSEWKVDVCLSLILGAARGYNLACVGNGGCGKSFLMEPYEMIFNTAAKPSAGSTFPLMHLMGCELILWQDYKHSQMTVDWSDLLCVTVSSWVGSFSEAGHLVFARAERLRRLVQQRVCCLAPLGACPGQLGGLGGKPGVVFFKTS